MNKEANTLAALHMREAEGVIAVAVRAPYVEEIDVRLFPSKEEAREFRDKAKRDGFVAVSVTEMSMVYGNDKTAAQLSNAIREVNKLIDQTNLVRRLTLKQRLLDGLYMAAAYSAVLALIILARP